MQKLIFLFIGIVFSLAITVPVLPGGQVKAAGREAECQIIYGGGEVCPPKHVKFTINKQVQKPGKGGGNYVENLTINDPRYAPSQNVNFKIIVENTGNTDITNLNVTDTFPEFLSFVAGVGNANVGARQISFVIGKLERGKRMEFLITAKTADADKLPANQTITCVTNHVKAVAPDAAAAEDNSQVCIEKQVLGKGAPPILEKPTVKELPPTGPELGLLAALIPAGLAGIYLRRKTG
jgi:uncharacterized repeat protein (TIGR01451 family)